MNENEKNELNQIVDDILKKILFSPAYPLYEMSIDKLMGSKDFSQVLDNAIKDVRKKIVSEYGDIIVDVSKAIMQSAVALIMTGGAGIGFGLGLLDLGRLYGQQYANTVEPIQIPDIQTLTDAYQRGLIDDLKYRESMLKYGYTPEWQSVFKEVLKNRATPDSLRKLFIQGFLPTDRVIKEFRKMGFDLQQTVYFLSAGYNRLGVSEAVSLYLRGVITEQELDQYLRWNGLPYDDIPRFKELIWVIPSISDLIRLAVRDAFNEVAIEKFQYLQDFPEAILPYTRAQGLSDEWAKRFWIAHWELPSITEGFAMFTRTTEERLDPDADVIESPWGKTRYNVIGRKTLRLLMRISDISPFWRDKLEQLAYNPLTRVDVRRAFDLGVIDESEVYFTYRDLGYNDRNARILTLFTILDTISEERNKLRTELIEAYQKGYISVEELREALKKLKYPDQAIEILIQYAEYKKTNDFIKEYIQGIKYDYIHGIISESEAHDLLVRYGILESDVANYVRLWNVEKRKYRKLLTKEDIRGMLMKGILTKDQAIEKLVAIGYTQSDANLLVKYWSG